jgi:hypothetical protein
MRQEFRMLSQDRSVALRHPLYLDIPMMMSYLAYLTDGVSQTIEQTTSTKYGMEKGKGGEGGIKIPAGGLADVNFSGRFSSSDVSGSSTEQKLQRQHTSASLFNVLLDYLTDQNMVASISLADLSTTPAGDLIRASGTLLGTL